MLGVSKDDWDIFCEAGWLLDVDLVLYRDEDVEYELVILFEYSFFKASNFWDRAELWVNGLFL